MASEKFLNMTESDFENHDDMVDVPMTEDDEPLRTLERMGKKLEIVSRSDWLAAPGGEQSHFIRPCEDVIFSYTETDECYTREECVKLMRQMQTAHRKEGHPDVKFNFVIGGDGVVYEGTGWTVRAPQNPSYPDLLGRHMEFAHTGYRRDFPTPLGVATINSLYARGEELRYIANDARSYIDYMWGTDGL